MILIHKARQTGKTTKLIEEALKLKGYNLIVCINRRHADFVWRVIVEKQYNLPQPITFKEFIEGSFRGRNINAFLIDNADAFLMRFARDVKIHAVTFNKGE